MSLRDVIEGGLRSLPDCLSISYVDMPARLVLATASREPASQEVLDRYAAIAGRLFAGPGLAALSEAEAPDEAAVLGARHAYLFLRAARDPDHALCLVCRRDGDLGALRGRARALCGEAADAL